MNSEHNTIEVAIDDRETTFEPQLSRWCGYIHAAIMQNQFVCADKGNRFDWKNLSCVSNFNLKLCTECISTIDINQRQQQNCEKKNHLRALAALNQIQRVAIRIGREIFSIACATCIVGYMRWRRLMTTEIKKLKWFFHIFRFSCKQARDSYGYSRNSLGGDWLTKQLCWERTEDSCSPLQASLDDYNVVKMHHISFDCDVVGARCPAINLSPHINKCNE